MNDLPRLVHKEWDGYVMQQSDGRFTAFEYAVKVPPGVGKILLADHYLGVFDDIEDAKSAIRRGWQHSIS